MKRYWPLLILALLPLIPLWRAVFLGETIGAFDEIRPIDVATSGWDSRLEATGRRRGGWLNGRMA